MDKSKLKKAVVVVAAIALVAVAVRAISRGR